MSTDQSHIEISHGERVIYPDVGITKQDVVDYYRRVADHVTPHLWNRPLVMYRFPDGLGSDGFIQKQTPSHFPAWIETATVPRRRGGHVEHVVVCDDVDTLLYVVNQGGFELHTLLAPADEPEHPDQLVIDLDPSTNDIEPVVEAARAARDVLDDLDVRAFVKSTGSRGVHIHIGLDGGSDVDEVHDTARALAQRIVYRDPERFTIAQSKSDRGDRVFIDWLRNGYGQHAVAPFSLRARTNAPVAVPMAWDEVTSSAFDPQGFTITNVFRRLGQKSDPWEGMDDARYPLSALEV